MTDGEREGGVDSRCIFRNQNHFMKLVGRIIVEDLSGNKSTTMTKYKYVM